MGAGRHLIFICTTQTFLSQVIFKMNFLKVVLYTFDLLGIKICFLKDFLNWLHPWPSTLTSIPLATC